MERKRFIFLMVVGCLLPGFLTSEVHANIVIKVRALNPLEREETASIFYPLPREISPKDIISKNITYSLPPEEGKARRDTFNVEDVEGEGRYSIVDEILLGPREVVTLEVRVKDIWMIPEERLENIKREVGAMIARYPQGQDPSVEIDPQEDPEPVEAVPDETVLLLQAEIFEQIDKIAAQQEQSSVLRVGVEGHMEAYYENMEALTQVGADVEMLRLLLEPEEEEEAIENEFPGEDEISESAVPLEDPVEVISEEETAGPEGAIAK